MLSVTMSGMMYIETSSKTGENVELAFMKLAEMTYKEQEYYKQLVEQEQESDKKISKVNHSEEHFVSGV